MQMVRLLWGALLAIFLLGIALWVSGLASHCCSAREEPSRMEIFVARLVRTWSLPASARQSKNPLASSPQLLQDAARHFADHCASCHANDGSGNTEIGRNLYPRAPDMRLPATQQLSDGDSSTSFTTAFAGLACPHGVSPATILTVGNWSSSSVICPTSVRMSSAKWKDSILKAQPNATKKNRNKNF